VVRGNAVCELFSMREIERLSALIGDFYDAVLDPN